MDKKRHEPSAWKWEEGIVNTKEEYIKVGYGGFEDPFVPMAPGEGNCFIVQFLVKKDEIDPNKQENYEAMIKELNFFLVEKREEKPWEYAKYHCGTASNMYSTIRWAYYPKENKVSQQIFLMKQNKDKNGKKIIVEIPIDEK